MGYRTMMSYEPTEQDVLWLKNILSQIKSNGIWGIPATRVAFRKTGDNELTMILIESPKKMLPQVDDLVTRTQAVADKAGIKLIIDERLVKVKYLK
jgi:hypothetical protein